MSVIQLEDLVAYQLRTSYLNEIADGVGERLINVNDSVLNTAPFKAAGWRPTSSHTKRTHSPPIPTAIASEYFQAPRQAKLTLEDGFEDGGMLTAGGADTVGPGAATKRRRRREQMEEDDSSDLSDESEDEAEQRAAQQIKFAKMPVRNRAGSSPLQSTHLGGHGGGGLGQPVVGSASPRATRRGSQASTGTSLGAAAAVPGRPRRDTVTSSEVSSENEFDVPAAFKHREAREAARQATRAMRMHAKINEEEPSPGLQRVETLLPEEEEEEEEEEEDDEDDSDEGSDMLGDYAASIDEASILAENPITASPSRQVVGTPPKNFTRQSTIRKSVAPPPLPTFHALPPPRPMSTIRPMSVVQPRGLLSAALKAQQHKSSVPFQKFAHLNGQGAKGSIALRIYAAFSKTPNKPFEVFIRPRVHHGQGAERAVTVADLIGLGLYRYVEEKREPGIPAKKRNINWWMLRMVEEGGEVDDDFRPFERTKPLTDFTTVNNANMRGGGRIRSNSKVYDEFAIVEARESEFEENQRLTPQEDEDVVGEDAIAEETAAAAAAAAPVAPPKHAAAAANVVANTGSPVTGRPRQNPILFSTYRPNVFLADAPQTRSATPNTNRGQQKLLRIYIISADLAAGQMVTVDITTEMYLAEVLDLVCRKRQLDKATHVLKIPGSGAVVMLDRPVSSIGNVTDLELHRRRFATDGTLAVTGSPGSSSPKSAMPLLDGQVAQKKGYYGHHHHHHHHHRGNKNQPNPAHQMLGLHPLAREARRDELGSANYKKYTVWRKQPMRIVGMSERCLVIDGEYIHIVPASGGKPVYDGGGKTTTVHFSNVIGCKVLRKHPTNVKLVVYKATESKRYDFEARGAEEAAEIVAELKKGISPYHEIV